jgi:hypothetical protein
VVEAGEERDAAAALAEQRGQQLSAVAESQARLAAQVDGLSGELQAARGALAAAQQVLSFPPWACLFWLIVILPS